MKNVKGNDTILVNKWNPIKESEIPTLKEMIGYKTKLSHEPLYLKKSAYHAFSLLKKEAYKHGYEVEIESAFRSFQEQEETMNEFIKLIGVEEARKRVSLVGTSEHHTGLAIDIVFFRDGKLILGDDLKVEDEDYNWVLNHLSDYGFILRYPKGSMEITGVIYEPWHIRYVGVKLAKYLEKNHLLLEEYDDMKN